MRFLLPFNTRSIPESFYADFHAGLTEAAQELGHEALRFDIAEGANASDGERNALYRLLAAQPCDAVIDLCCWGLGLSAITVWDGSEGGEPLFDSLDMDYVGLLCDQPWFQPLPGVRSSRLHVAVPDRHHPTQIALAYPDLALRGTAFTPPAARAVNDQSRPWRERDIEVLYVGHLQQDALAMAKERRWPAGVSALCEATIEEALARPTAPLHEDMQRAARALGQTPTPDQALDVLRNVEPHLRARFRRDAVHAAARSRATVHVVGLGWDQESLPPNVIHYAPVTYPEFHRMAGRARIGLDVSAYPGGANDRVFNYSLNRAVCLTNALEYPRTSFEASGAIQSHDLGDPARLAAQIDALLAEPDRLRDSGEAGHGITLATQNWRLRLESIIAMLDRAEAAPAGR